MVSSPLMDAQTLRSTGAPAPEPPPSLERRRAAELTAETAAVLAAQRAELELAVERCLAQLPFPMRVVVRRALAL